MDFATPKRMRTIAGRTRHSRSTNVTVPPCLAIRWTNRTHATIDAGSLSRDRQDRLQNPEKVLGRGGLEPAV
jgi:hypothetical protein